MRAKLGQLIRAEATTARSVRLNALRVSARTNTVTDQLDIERDRLPAAVANEQARAQLTQNYIVVNEALGLGCMSPPVAMMH